MTLSGPVLPEVYLMPIFLGRQHGQTIGFRLVSEPNTLVQGTSEFILVNPTVTYVLEVAEITAFAPDLNQPFEITAGYAAPVETIIPLTPVAAYNAAAYPTATADLELSGYLTGSYYDPARSGEGMLLEIAEVGTTLIAVVSWYSFDGDGFPFWFVGAAPFQHGARSVTVNVGSKFGGRLAGNFDPATLQDLPWGNVTLSFPSCRQLRFSYQSTHNIQGLPAGQGDRTWTRLTSVNKFACE